jgi:hypothetical protein
VLPFRNRVTGKTSDVPIYRIQYEKADLAIEIGKRGNYAESLTESERLIAFLDRNGSPRSILCCPPTTPPANLPLCNWKKKA